MTKTPTGASKKAKRCKHDIGWYLEGQMVFMDGSTVLAPVYVGWSRRNPAKLRVKCNKPDCGAFRNIYLAMPQVVKIGRVHLAD